MVSIDRLNFRDKWVATGGSGVFGVGIDLLFHSVIVFLVLLGALENMALKDLFSALTGSDQMNSSIRCFDMHSY